MDSRVKPIGWGDDTELLKRMAKASGASMREVRAEALLVLEKAVAAGHVIPTKRKPKGTAEAPAVPASAPKEDATEQETQAAQPIPGSTVRKHTTVPDLRSRKAPGKR
jgi:hypothetical protein